MCVYPAEINGLDLFSKLEIIGVNLIMHSQMTTIYIMDANRVN